MIRIDSRALWLAALIAVTSCAGCAHVRAAGPSDIWELRGAIVDSGGESLRIRHKTGQVVELVVDARTVVLHDEAREERGALRRGRRVRIVVAPQPDGSQLAKTVRVYGGS